MFNSNPYYPNTFTAAQNPYVQPTQAPRQEVVKVNGENGARAFFMGPNSSALLLDESGTLIWLVTTDGAGYKTVTPYDITPHQITPAPNYNDLELRISKLEELMNGYSGNTATVKPKNKYSDDAKQSYATQEHNQNG